MSVNSQLTANGPTVTGAPCTSCGGPSDALGAAHLCIACEGAAVRRRIAADELRTWKRYTPAGFR